MMVVHLDGTYVLVDPQTGEVVLPFDSMADAAAGVRGILAGGYTYDGDDDVTLTPSDERAGNDADIGLFY